MPGHAPTPNADDRASGSFRSPLIGLAALTAGLALSGWVAWEHAGKVTDFTQDYLAARALLAGRNVYDPVGEGELAPQGLSLAGHLDTSVQNYHPPFDGLVVVPVAWLPHRIAFLVWAALTVGLYLAVLVLLARWLRIPTPGYAGPFVCGLAMMWPPYLQHLHDGQFSLLIAACVCAAWRLSLSGRDTPAGLLIGFAAAMKMFPLLFLVYFLLRRRWRAFAAGLVAFALAVAASGWAAGWDVLHQYAAEIAPHNAAEYADNPYNLSIPGLLHRLFAAGRGASAGFPGVVPVVDLGPGVSWLKLGAALAVYGPVALFAWRGAPTRRVDDLGFALTAVAMLLLSPITWQHALVITLFPLALLWQRGDRAGVVVVVILFSFPVVAVAREIVQRYYPNPTPGLWTLLPAVPTLGLLILGWRLGRTWRSE